MLTPHCLSPLLILQDGLRYRNLGKALRLPIQITRLASTSITRLTSILQPSIVNIGTASQITVPRIIYSTARKHENTEDLVYHAIKHGYRGIETGAEPLKYDEKAVGAGIRRAIQEGIVERKDLYIQTTFAPLHGQDLHSLPENFEGTLALKQVLRTLPYSISSSVSQQIHSSIASSLENLKTSDNEKDTYIDCLVLRSPFPTKAETKEAWGVMSTYVPHSIRSLGIASNSLKDVGRDHLIEDGRDEDRFSDDVVGENQEPEKDHPSNQNVSKANKPNILPSIYTNRFKKHKGQNVGFNFRDVPKKDMVFQSSWITTAMSQLVDSPLSVEIRSIFEDLGYAQIKTNKLVIYALVLALRLHGLAILDGCSDPKRMWYDMKALQALQRWSANENREREESGGMVKGRWAWVERAARRFFSGAEWKEEIWREDEEGKDGDYRREINGTVSQDWDIDAAAEPALNKEEAPVYSLPPKPASWDLLNRPPENIYTTPFSSLPDINTKAYKTGSLIRRIGAAHEPTPNDPSQPQPDLSNELELGIQPVKDNSRERSRRNKEVIDKLLKKGASLSVILEEKKRQKIEGNKMRRNGRPTLSNWGRNGQYSKKEREKRWKSRQEAYGD